MCETVKTKVPAPWTPVELEVSATGAVAKVWGRVYRDFDDIEMPQEPSVFSDFIDFRSFHLDKMAEEAGWRIDTVKKLDSEHPVYLHVVPNTSSIFNAITFAIFCVEDRMTTSIFCCSVSSISF